MPFQHYLIRKYISPSNKPHKRPKLRKNINKYKRKPKLRIDTKDKSCARFVKPRQRQFRHLIIKYIPYKKDSRGVFCEDERQLSGFVERGIYPFTNGQRVEGPAAQRSVFDYLSRKSIDEIVKIQRMEDNCLFTGNKNTNTPFNTISDTVGKDTV